ncbi:MAG TPA: ribose 5-phosphate isomerase B [Candidatus Atribacteria bacterium]|jgi:ribose 5-phosphate isomerase B|nr:ribose 5-phosphate isomerase B [Candidatus Atribacteria bacterium]
MTDSINRIKIIRNVVSGLYSATTPEKVQPVPSNVRDKVECVAIGSDHGGFEAKEVIRDYLRNIGYRVTDVGAFSKDSVDYPDFALKVAKKVASGECDRGIMIDGAGIGSSMVCNKVKGVRAALCYNQKTIINSKEHNNANVLTLGGPLHTTDELREMVKLWLETTFAGGRHWKRVNKIMAVERNQ